MVDANFKQQVIDEGGRKCHTCGQHAQLYKRKFNCEMAYGIIRLERLSVALDGYHHVKDIMKGYSNLCGGDFAKCEYWGLIKRMPHAPDAKKTSGFWRITEKGKGFALNIIPIESHVFIYNSKCEGFSNENVWIGEALNNKFDYEELMSGEVK